MGGAIGDSCVLVDRAVVNPLSIAPTVDDITDPTLAVDLRGSAESRPRARDLCVGGTQKSLVA